MERYAWRAKVRPECISEYRKRHDNLWPEMKSALKRAGIVNYSIWLDGHDLFGYYECEKGAAFAAKSQSESPVVKRWEEHMKDIMIMELDENTGAQPLMAEVFRLD